jgi:hypothetical protein
VNKRERKIKISVKVRKTTKPSQSNKNLLIRIRRGLQQLFFIIFLLKIVSMLSHCEYYIVFVGNCLKIPNASQCSFYRALQSYGDRETHNWLLLHCVCVILILFLMYMRTSYKSHTICSREGNRR